MSKTDTMNMIRETRQKIRNAFHNCVKCSKSPAEGPMHRLTKFQLAEWCWHHGLDFSTEAEFFDGQRADFVVHNWGVAFEVLHTESTEEFRKKKYPIKTIPISSGIEFTFLEMMMLDLKTTNGKGADYYIKHGVWENAR